MDILLINPPWLTKDGNIWHGVKSTSPPLGLLYVAAYAEARGRSVYVMDVNAEQLSPDEIERFLTERQPRWVGLTAVTAQISSAHRVARSVKRLSPDSNVVLGGVHAMAMPDEVLRDQCVDYVIRGEGEVPFGNPGETVESMRCTIDFAKSLDPDIAIFNITTPYPGTRMFEWVQRNGYLRTSDWDDFDLANSVLELPTVSSAVVNQMYKVAYREFYFRPKYLLRRLLRMRSLIDIRMSVQALRSVLFTRATARKQRIETTGGRRSVIEAPSRRPPVAAATG